MKSHSSSVKPFKSVYRPGLSTLDRLKKTAIGHREIVAGFIKVLEESADNHSPDHTLFVGPPGIGKTHLLKLLADKIANSKFLMKHYWLIVFPVENHKIISLSLLLIEIVKHLQEVTNDTYWSDLLNKCDEANDEMIRKYVTNSIKQYSKTSGRRLLIIFESFSVFFSNLQENRENVDAFSKFLTQCDSASFIGTSTAPITHNVSYKNRPFSLFNIHPMNELSLEQTRKLILVNLKFDQQTELIKKFENLTEKIQALHQLTGGNPRLILLLYPLLIDEDSQNIKSQFEELLDKVTPFYQERLRFLSSIDRALLATLASLRAESHTKTSLAKVLRIGSQQCNASINRLVEHGYLAIAEHPTNKRSNIYQIKEGFFDLWLAIGQLKNPKRFLPFLEEFLEKWYLDKSGRERKRQQLWHSLQIAEVNKNISQIENAETLLHYLANIGNQEEQCQNQLEICFHFAAIDKKQAATKMLKTVRAALSEDPVEKWVFDNIGLIVKGTAINGHKKLLIDLFQCWKYQRTQTLDEVVSMAIKVSTHFEKNGNPGLNTAFLRNTLKQLKKDAHRLPLYVRMAGSQEKEGLLEDALESWQKVLKITDSTNDLKSKGTTLNNISQVLQDQGDYSAALDYLEQALETLQWINDFNGQSTTLNNIATVYYTQGYFEKALEYFEQTLSIVQRTGDHSLKAITLSNISFIYKARGEFEKAINCLEQSLVIMKKTGNYRGEAKTMINISQIYGELEELERCYEFFQPSMQIMLANADFEDACNALLVMGKIFWNHHHEEMALSNWSLLKKLALENHLPNSLEKLRELTHSLGIDELSSAIANG